MGNIFNGLIAIFTNMFFKAETVVLQGVAAILGELPGDETAIVQDALTAISKDLSAGKSIGEAAADAWTTFYSEEKTEFSKVGQQVVQLFITALETANGAPPAK